MSDSEDEVEAVVHSVTNYYFEDEQSEPISFTTLPVKWSESEKLAIGTHYLFLNGISDSGAERIYKKVTAWKVEFSNEQPKISVLAKEQSWIELQKPRKSFEDTIRTILITIQCLHFVRKHPETSECSMWTYLQKIFSLYKAKPSENDLVVHLPLIRAAVVNDKVFSKSKFLLKLLNGTKKRKALNEDMVHDFLVKKTKSATEGDQQFNKETGNGNEPIEVWDLCDDVCALCDNGGELVCCEGRCLRSFHATADTGFVSGCKSLGLSKNQVNANFTCMNCQFKEHQCFACGKLGSSDISKVQEVFRCASVTCGHFYHPRCIAKLLHPINGHAADQVQKTIMGGGSFICTVHKCYVCKKEEVKDDKEMQFAICRRCPKVYHRKCLPREISLETLLDEGILQRAWLDLLPNRILIYCLKHEIDISTLTPVDKFIKFPNVQEKKKVCQPDLQSKQGMIATKRKNEPAIKVHSSIKGHASTKVHVNKTSEVKHGSKKKSERFDAFFMKGRVRCKSQKVVKSTASDDNNGHRKEENRNKVLRKGLKSEHPRKQLVSCSEIKETLEHSKKQSHSPPTLRIDRRKREMDLMREKSSLRTMDIVEETLKEASPLAFTNNIADKTNSLEKAVEVSEEKIEDDCSDVVTTSHEPEYFDQRTKSMAVEALEERLEDDCSDVFTTSHEPKYFDQLTKSMIADKLLYYTRDGDTILNFCCHDTSFSCMMREKFVEAQKRCSVQNYDLFESKGDVDFQNKDWIPTTSRLIVGLIFPNGVGGVSINELIDKILEFKKPKLLLVLCPKETKGLERTSLFCRVDEKELMYQLIWEEDDYFSCKGTQTPVLYLWSRWDWTKTYKPIALRVGKLPNSHSEVETNPLLEITNQVNFLAAESSEVEGTKEDGEEPMNITLHFVHGPLPSFSDRSCGWLVE